MKKTRMILVLALGVCTAGYGQNGENMLAEVGNEVSTNQNQNVAVDAGDVHLNSSGYEGRTPPLTTFPPYLPYWTHGGWGTIKAYFPNGPTGNDQIYETTFDPRNPDDMRELRSVLQALPHKGVLAAVGGVLNGVAAALFGTPDAYFHGRGLEIANSVVRDRRPEGKALLVFIDSNVDAGLLAEEGYAYAGKVSVEGDTDRNWDQAYKAAIAEALLWDVDILLVSGGMKGVTTGTNTTFPSAAGGYSQANYSLSLLGGRATGITEGKGKAVLSAEAFRYTPQTVERRRIPMALYDRIRSRPRPAAGDEADRPSTVVPQPNVAPSQKPLLAPPAVGYEMMLPPTEIFQPSPDAGEEKVLQPAAAESEMTLPPTEIFRPISDAEAEPVPEPAVAVTEIAAPATPATEPSTPGTAEAQAPGPDAATAVVPATCGQADPGPVESTPCSQLDPEPVAPAPCVRPDPGSAAPAPCVDRSPVALVPTIPIQAPAPPCSVEPKCPAPLAPEPTTPTRAPARPCGVKPKRTAYQGPGITMSRELFELAGFSDEQQVGYVRIIEK